MKKKEFEEEGDIKIREIIDGISKMRKKYDVTFPENKKQMNTIYLFVTDYCNLNCEFCAMRSNNKDIKKVCLVAEGSMFWSINRKDKNYSVLVMEELEKLLNELGIGDVKVHVNKMNNANLIGTAIAALS